MNHADMHRIAMKDPFHSTEQVFDADNKGKLLGVKNDPHIPVSWIRQLKEKGYFLHTVDHKSAGGRAVDLQLVNPLTGRWMSGSSSGTAVNVFLGMNDVGIGTDGGGSVLAPAMSLNLFGFISPLLCGEWMKQFAKTSTDGITFTPSIGFITGEWEMMKQIIRDTMVLPGTGRNPVILAQHENFPFPVKKTSFPDIYGSREECIPFLRENLAEADLIVSEEGPVDLLTYGDTVMGHFDETTHAMQRKSGKGLLRCVNMAGASALCIPNGKLGCGTVLICRSEPEEIAMMIQTAENLVCERDALCIRYFQNPDTWCADGFEGGSV